MKAENQSGLIHKIDFTPLKLESFRSYLKFEIYHFLVICLYFIFVQFMQFPVLNGLVHSALH